MNLPGGNCQTCFIDPSRFPISNHGTSKYGSSNHGTSKLEGAVAVLSSAFESGVALCHFALLASMLVRLPKIWENQWENMEKNG